LIGSFQFHRVELLPLPLVHTYPLHITKTADDDDHRSTGLSMGHIYLSHPMGFPLDYYNINMEYNSIKITKLMKV